MGNLWISDEEINRIQLAGTVWDCLLNAADGPFDDARPNNRESLHHSQVMAAALIARRATNPTGWQHTVRDQLARTMSIKPDPNDVLGSCRRLVAYVLAADIANLDSLDPAFTAQFKAWLRAELRRPYAGGGGGGSIVSISNKRPNNWQHATTSRIAVDLYIGDHEDLADAAAAHRAMLGETAFHVGFFEFGDLWWQSNPLDPRGINPPGATIRGFNVDGIIPDDMRRGGLFQWPLPKTGDGVQYTYECLQALTVSTVLLARNAYYDAPQWGSSALLRVIQSQYLVAGTRCTGDDVWMPDLWHYLYGDAVSTFVPLPPLDKLSSHRAGKNISWTTWSHRGRRLERPVEPPPSEPPEPPVDPCADVRAELEAARSELSRVLRERNAAVADASLKQSHVEQLQRKIEVVREALK